MAERRGLPGLDVAGFDDLLTASRRLFAELFGTFLLVLAGAGAAVVGAIRDGAIGRPAAVASPGLMMMAIILVMGNVSGPSQSRRHARLRPA